MAVESPSPAELCAWLRLRARAAAAGTCAVSSPCRAGISAKENLLSRKEYLEMARMAPLY